LPTLKPASQPDIAPPHKPTKAPDRAPAGPKAMPSRKPQTAPPKAPMSAPDLLAMVVLDIYGELQRGHVTVIPAPDLKGTTGVVVSFQ